MAITTLDIVSNVDIDEGLGWRVAKVTLDNSYPTGGEALAASDLQLSSIKFVLVTQEAPTDTNAISPAWDYTNSKIMCFRTDQVDDFMEQIPNATDLSTVVLRLLAMGAPE